MLGVEFKSYGASLSANVHKEPPRRIVLMVAPQVELTIDEYLRKNYAADLVLKNDILK